MTSAARREAFDALVALEGGTVDLPGALSAARGRLRDHRDQALLTELVAGTVRMRAAIDYQLAQRTDRPIAALDLPVVTALRLGAFQLLYLTRTPASAVVNDLVALTKRAGRTSASGMVNAILRRLDRERDAIRWPEGASAAALSIRYSHPEWLVERWLTRHGVAETHAWLAFNNQPPRLCLAANRWRATRDELAARLRREGVDTVPATHASDGLIVNSGAALSTGAFREGWFVVQDEASQLIGALGGKEKRHAGRLLDLCAAPGGKTQALSWRAGPDGRVVACDVRPRRVRLLRSTIDRLGLPNVSTVQVGASGHAPFAPRAFDFVLVDAPCSGLGTLRRDPDIRWRRSAADFGRLAAMQLTLLHRIAELVSDGGTLVYATCSSEPEENEEVVAAFVGDRRDFELSHVHRTWPHRDGLEAFYGAVLTRHL